jgi:SagB-type dehydrogenase family enzyme
MLSAEELQEALERARLAYEVERRDQFLAFGLDPECAWPASRLYHAHSALGPAWRPQLSLDEIAALTHDNRYRSYPGTPRLALPDGPELTQAFEAVARARRSSSSFAASGVALTELSKILALACGSTSGREGVRRRAAPSGGALYPVEAYVLNFNCVGLRPGVHHYLSAGHVLERLHDGPVGEAARTFLPPGLVDGQPSLMIVLSAVFARTQLKYVERGYRFALLEAGHIAQNMLLAAEALGLAACPVGGFWDDPLNDLLGFDSNEEAAVYGVLIGAPQDQMTDSS